MKITLRHLRRIILEAMEQDLRGNLDPNPGHMSVIQTHDPTKDYLLWAKTNGMSPKDMTSIAAYAEENNLSTESIELKKIINSLKLPYNTASSLRNQMTQEV